MHNQMTWSCHLNLFFYVWWNPHWESTSVTTSAPIWLDWKWSHLSWLTRVQISKKTQNYQTLIIPIALIQPEICYSGRLLSLFVTHSAILVFSSRGKRLFLFMWSLSLYLGNTGRDWNARMVSFASRIWLMHSVGFRLAVRLQPHFGPKTQIRVPFRKATLVK